MANKNNECVIDEVMDVVDPEKVLGNRRKYVQDALKSAEKARDELEKATATEKVRLQGTKETKAPNLKPYTESFDVRDRHELGKLICGAKRDGRTWSVERCSEAKLKEGYRYTFRTTKLQEAFNESLIRPTVALREEEEEFPPEAEEFIEVELGSEEPLELPEEPKLETFDEQMDFLAADEQEAIDGYEKVLALVEDEHVKEQLQHILDEEIAHKEFLEAVKKDKSLVYSHEDKEEKGEEELPAVELEEPIEAAELEESVDIHVDTDQVTITDEEGEEIALIPLELDRDELPEEEPEEIVDDEMVSIELGSEEPEELEEASSAEKKAYRRGGKDLKDLEFGRALAQIKDPHERAMLLHQKRMEKSGKKMSDRPETDVTLKRHLNNAEKSLVKKQQTMAKAGVKDEEQVLNENVKISLDDLRLFNPWGGAKDVWELIVAQDKLEALDKALEDMYPDGITASDLNDILWFEKDWVFDTLGVDPFIKQDDAIEADAEVVEPEIEEPEEAEVEVEAEFPEEEEK